MNRAKNMVLIAQKLSCFVETASRLYEKAENEGKVDELNLKLGIK